MKAAADSTVELASPERLDVGFEIESATATLHDGSELDVEADGTEVILPAVPAPASARVTASGPSGEASAFNIEFVSRHYFDIREIREGSDREAFADLGDDDLSRARRMAVEVFERNSGRCFIERIGATRVYACDGFVTLAHADVTELIEAPEGYRLVSHCQAAGPATGDPASFVYRYGTGNVPEKVRKAVLMLAEYYAREVAWSARTQSISTDEGFMRLSIAGQDGPTGLPEVDAVMDQFGIGRPFIW